jgi:hypothetical protein
LLPNMELQPVGNRRVPLLTAQNRVAAMRWLDRLVMEPAG